MIHSCVHIVKDGKYTNFFSCEEKHCSFGGTLSEAIKHAIENQFVVDARLKYGRKNEA
jgi:hypothetical protein